MLYCFDIGLKTLDSDYSEREMALSKINGNGILYDDDLKEFRDSDGNIFDITGKVIFPRTGVSQIYDMNDEIVKQGGIPIITNEQIDLVVDWPNHYTTDRKTQIFKGKDLVNIDVVEKLQKEYGEEIFIKTKDKNFNSVIPISLLKDNECAFYITLTHHLEDEFIISEKVNIIEDEFGKKEYRCFIVDNQVYNISRLTTEVLHEIDEDVLLKVQEIVEQMKDKFRGYYVVDLFKYEKDGEVNIDVVEFNPIHSSGLYLYNSCMEKSNDLLHSNLKNVSHEFIGDIDEFITNGSMINNRDNLYNMTDGFSYNLRSICATGSIGVWTTFKVSEEDFASHPNNSFFGMVEEITDDTFMKQMSEPNYDEETLELLEKVKKLMNSKNKGE
ncbi:MAG: DUF4343 domain-containing protein [Lactobacillales bacterium]|nr:DUF4343 domain-containing protein [Lactobacillales bacterium]